MIVITMIYLIIKKYIKSVDNNNIISHSAINIYLKKIQ